MKRKTNLKLLVGILIAICLITLNSKIVNASIEIIPSKAGTGKDAIVNTTISNSYLLCQQMKESGQALGRTSVVPHLATNLDWGAVSYLSNSSYGTNTEGGNTGVQITINNVKYYSTNGNLTGVMNWGANPNTGLYTQTSGLIKIYDHDLSSSASNVVTLYENKDTRFVDNVDTKNFTIQNTLGMALRETDLWYNSGWDTVSSSVNWPVSIRKGLFGFIVGTGRTLNSDYVIGAGSSSWCETFRPVVWNE